MKWNRVTDYSSYIKSGDMMPQVEDHSLSRRFYSFIGEKYPLRVITIYPNVGWHMNEDLVGVKISTSFKRKSGAWWDDYDAYIPLELLDEVSDMIAEVKKKLK